MPTKKKSKIVRRTPKTLSHTLYSYTRPENGRYARTWGKKNFGSFSAYVDALITIDRKKHFSKTAIEKTPKVSTAKAA